MHHKTDSDGVTRRDALKRGVVIAGALWAVPAVQALGVSQASADSPSGGRGGGGGRKRRPGGKPKR